MVKMPKRSKCNGGISSNAKTHKMQSTTQTKKPKYIGYPLRLTSKTRRQRRGYELKKGNAL